jgi:hypothetical protein
MGLLWGNSNPEYPLRGIARWRCGKRFPPLPLPSRLAYGNTRRQRDREKLVFCIYSHHIKLKQIINQSYQ